MRQSFGGVALITYPIDGGDVSSAPTNKIPSTSLQHAYLKEERFGLKVGDTPVNSEVFLHMANGAEVIQSFYCGCIATGSAASITFDLLKNGTTILSAPVTVANTDPSRTKKAATVTSVTLADNDILTAKIVTSSTTGMQGPFVQLSVVAAASPS